MLAKPNQFAMIGEYGGVGVFVDGHSWVEHGCHAYANLSSSQEYADQLVQWMGHEVGDQRGNLSAAVYTQLTDVEVECDGMLNFDRTHKFTDAQAAAVRKASEALIGQPVCCDAALCGGGGEGGNR